MHPTETASPGGDKIAFAHMLRGLAALLVLIGHLGHTFWMLPGIGTMLGAPPMEPHPYWFTILLDRYLPPGFVGHFAVALFFLISGFVIPFSLLNRTRLQFAAARVLRLWPTYAIGLTITALLVIACASWFGQPRPFPWRTYFLQLVFVRDLAWVPSIDGIAWTLEIEAKFYLLMALLAGAVRLGRIGPLLLTAVALLCLTVGASFLPMWNMSLTPLYRGLYGLTLSGQMICFMFIGTIFNFVYRGLLSWRVGGFAIAFLFGTLLVQWPLGVIAATSKSGLLSYAIALAFFAGAYAARHRMQRAPAALSWLADISYPLYVIHGVAGYALMRMAFDAGIGMAGCIAIATVFAFAAATVMHHFIEVPTQSIGKAISLKMGARAGSADMVAAQPAA
jgi:peptidoglycan/LPS O-acetylase OafA/YrhL